MSAPDSPASEIETETETGTEPGAPSQVETENRDRTDELTGPAAQPGDRRPGGALSSLVVVSTVALLCALALLLGYLAWQVRDRSQADAARTEALESARDAARLLFSYDHTSLDEDFSAGLETTTGDFREEYERTTRDVVRPVAEQYDAVVEAEVVDGAVVSASRDRVVALVFVNQTTTSTRVEGPKIDQSRVRMHLTQVDGEWRVAQVDAL
jgi:Mce-associated membrane protein